MNCSVAKGLRRYALNGNLMKSRKARSRKEALAEENVIAKSNCGCLELRLNEIIALERAWVAMEKQENFRRNCWSTQVHTDPIRLARRSLLG